MAKKIVSDKIMEKGKSNSEPENTSSWFEQKKNEIMKSVEGLSFTDQLKKLNGFIPMVKIIPGGEEWLKKQAYKIASLSSAPKRSQDELTNYNNIKSKHYSGQELGGNYDYNDGNRDLLKLAIYPDSTKGFTKIPEDIKKDAIIPLADKNDNEKYKDIPAYFANYRKSFDQLTSKDSLDYNSVNRTVGMLLNRNRKNKGLRQYNYDEITDKADSVLNSITPGNSVIYSTGLNNRNEVQPPYTIDDNLAGYVARIRRDAKTNDLHYDVNDIWDFDKNYGERWGNGDTYKSIAQEQADALGSVTKPYYLMATNPVAHPKTKNKYIISNSKKNK